MCTKHKAAWQRSLLRSPPPPFYLSLSRSLLLAAGGASRKINEKYLEKLPKKLFVLFVLCRFNKTFFDVLSA